MDPILSYIGYYGPYILFLLSLLFVFPQKILFLYTILGFIANQSINSTFKHVFKQERPSNTFVHFTPSGHIVDIPVNKMSDTDKYGMPSGHSQTVWFLTTFLYLALKTTWITLLFASIACITSIQRVVYKNHTFTQVFVGACFGIIFAYFYYHLFRKFT
jgi:membrane-associated phospholipid phosphatase